MSYAAAELRGFTFRVYKHRCRWFPLHTGRLLPPARPRSEQDPGAMVFLCSSCLLVVFYLQSGSPNLPQFVCVFSLFPMWPSSHCGEFNFDLPMCPRCDFFSFLTPGLRDCPGLAAASAVCVRASQQEVEILHMCKIFIADPISSLACLQVMCLLLVGGILVFFPAGTTASVAGGRHGCLP